MRNRREKEREREKWGAPSFEEISVHAIRDVKINRVRGKVTLPAPSNYFTLSTVYLLSTKEETHERISRLGDNE